MAFIEEELSPNIWCLSETKLDNSVNFTLSNYTLVPCNQNRRGGGTAILIKKKFKFQVVRLDCWIEAKANNIDLVCVDIALNPNKVLRVCSLYSPPGRSGSFTDIGIWDRIFSSVANCSDVILCSDLNGHHSVWSSPDLSPDVEGKKIENAMELTHLVCLNSSEDTWRSADLRMSSAVDLVISSSGIASRSSWFLLETTLGSDHFPAIVRVDDISPSRIPGQASQLVG